MAAGLGLAGACAFPAAAPSQQAASVIVAPGNAAVTGFSGAVLPVQIAAGADPGETTFIDLRGPSLRVVDLQHMHGPPAAQLVGAPKPFTFTAAQVGQVFGVALDDNSPPDIYVAATSAYGLPIVAPGADGRPRHVRTGAPDATFMPGLWGPQGGPGSIWKIDGATGKVSLFANVMPGDRPNSGAALGGLAYDADSKSIFVADRESGFIYRLALDGRVLDRYDHGVAGRQAQGLPPVPWTSQQPIDVASPRFDSTDPATWNYAAPARRIFGLAVFRRRLYYAVADSLQVWSVGLGPDGSFGSDATIELAVPPAAGPTEISKIAFDEQGRMFLAERPAPTGAFDFAALAVPAIGRVLRYALVGATPDGRRIWQPAPDEYALGFPRDLRNGDGGVAIDYTYDHDGEIVSSSCGGFMWATGEDLRDSPDAALAARLSQSGPAHVDGLQGNGTWRIRRDDEPPLQSYFISYADEADDAAARGHMGDIAIARACTLHTLFYPYSPPPPPAGTPPIKRPRMPPGGTPPGGGPPPGGRPPPGGCPPNELRDVDTGGCVPDCPRPGIQVNGKCCSPATLAVNAACSNTSCPPGQTAIGPSNFCCSSGQVYTTAGGAPACCGGQVVNGRCRPPTPPIGSNCPAGYVPAGAGCCLASQMTSTGTCCPAGQAPGGTNNRLCIPFIPVHLPPLCCAAGQIPAAGPTSCCAAANVTTTGVCCSQPVDPNDRTHCPAQIQLVPACAAGYTRMPDGTCCNNRFVGADGRSCNVGRRPCAAGEFREPSGACVPIPSFACPPGEVRTRRGCSPVRPPCPPGEVRTRRGCRPVPPRPCPPGQARSRAGACVPTRPGRCPAGEVRTRRGACVPAIPRACPRGEVRNRLGRCVPTRLPLPGAGPGRPLPRPPRWMPPPGRPRGPILRPGLPPPGGPFGR